MQRIILLLLLLGINLCACEPFGLYLKGDNPAQVKIKGNTLYLKGILGKTSTKRIIKALHQNPNIDTLVIIYSDGSVYDEYNIKAAEVLYDRQITTKLLPFSRIASGAVDLFLAGKQRIIAPGARIGVHAWENKAGRANELPVNHEAHQFFLDFYQKIGVDTSFYWFSIRAANHNDIHWLSPQEIQQFELSTSSQ